MNERNGRLRTWLTYWVRPRGLESVSYRTLEGLIADGVDVGGNGGWCGWMHLFA